MSKQVKTPPIEMRIKDLERRRGRPGVDVAYIDKRLAKLRAELRGTESDEPSIETLMAWESQGYMEATDGCRVEPDGICPHGKKSWLLAKWLI